MENTREMTTLNKYFITIVYLIIVFFTIIISSYSIEEEEYDLVDLTVQGLDNCIKTNKKKDKDEALLNAQIKAIENAGVTISSGIFLENSILKKQIVRSQAEAYILPGYRIIYEGYEEDGCYIVVMTCTVKSIWHQKKISGKDLKGKKVNFKIIYLSHEYCWRYADSNIVEFKGNSIDFLPHLLSENIQKYISDSIDIICVGAASMEGNHSTEVMRARQRAKKLLAWVRKAITNKKNFNFYLLNVGQYNIQMKNNLIQNSLIDTAYQRKVIIISVIQRKGKVNIKQALSNALKKKEMQKIFDVNKYTMFNLIKSND